MQNLKAPLICVVLVLLAIGSQYGFGRLPVPHSRRLPVENFPARLGNWQGAPLAPVDVDVQRKLQTANIRERVYSDPSGNGIRLMLLTASESDDLHDPSVCFPSQGWTITKPRPVTIAGQSVLMMHAKMGAQAETVIYWMTGYNAPGSYRNSLVAQIAHFRGRVVGEHEGDSLFVRVLAPDQLERDGTLTRFVASVVPQTNALLDSGAAGQVTAPASKPQSAVVAPPGA